MNSFKNFFIPIFVLMFVLSACQVEPPAVEPPAVAIPVAKKSVPKFEAPAFLPPPRTIADILSIFDQSNRKPSAELETHLKTSRLQGPSRTDAESFALFYRTRHYSRLYLGLVNGSLADARKALEYYEKTRDYQQRRIGDVRRDIGFAEMNFGNYRNGIEHLKQSLADKKTIRTYSWLVLAYSLSGDLENARKLKSEGDAFAAKLLKNPRWSSRRILSIKIQQARMARVINAISGHWEKAEKFQRRLIQLTKLHPKASARWLMNAGNTLSTILRRQNRLIESEIAQRENVRLALGTYGKNHPLTAKMVRNLARTLSAQGRFQDAGRLLEEVRKINQRLGIPADSRPHGATLLTLGNNLVLREKWQEALVHYSNLRKNLVSNRWQYEKWFSSGVYFPLALIKIGRAKEAETFIRSILAEDAKIVREARRRTLEKTALLGMALHAQNKSAEAYAAFHDAIPTLISQGGRSNDDENVVSAREWRLRQYLDSYIDLLSRLHNTDAERTLPRPAAWEAFRMAEFARSSTVHKAISAAGIRAASGSAELASLIRQEQNLAKQEEALLGLLVNVVSAPTDQQDPKVVRNLRKKIEDLRLQRSDVSRSVEERFPDYAKLVNAAPSTADAAARSLRAGEALIATYTTDKKTYVWALRRSGRIAFVAAPAGTAQISSTVRRLRRALNPAADTLGAIPRFDVNLAHQLYRTILAPVEDSWKDASRLLTVLHGPLGQLPLSLLVTEPTTLKSGSGALFSNYRAVPWLVRTHAVTVLPSVSSLAVLRNLPRRSRGRRSFAGFADPYFSLAQANAAKHAEPPVQTASLINRAKPAAINRAKPAARRLSIRLRATPKLDDVSSAGIALLPRLPDTASEIESMASAMNADPVRDVFTGARATEGRVKTMKLSGYKVLAFATHGLVPGDLDGLIQPALALSSPSVTGGQEDGLLTMGEIFGLKLDADWVVLSACNTASGNGAGAEAVSGLGRAFFYAGTRALLVSNWPVETNSARALTTDLFRRQAKDPSLSRADALRQAMLGLIDGPGMRNAKGLTIFSHAHPIFWAPFSLVGDGSGGKPSG